MGIVFFVESVIEGMVARFAQFHGIVKSQGAPHDKSISSFSYKYQGPLVMRGPGEGRRWGLEKADGERRSSGQARLWIRTCLNPRVDMLTCSLVLFVMPLPGQVRSCASHF